MNQKLAYLTAATMMIMMDQGIESPMISRTKKPETKYDKKKCKSCKKFHKSEGYRRSYCNRFTFRSPMDCACKDYQKRKR